MNGKQATLLRKYCKKYKRPYKFYKEQFKRLPAKEKFNLLINLKKAL